MFAYVKNYASVLGDKNEVSGMLLYAKTNQGVQPDFEYHMSGNRISVKTLDGIEPYPRSPCFSMCCKEAVFLIVHKLDTTK